MTTENAPGPEYIDTDDQSARWFRADLFSREDAASECALLLHEADVTEAWFTCRWTTEEERADEDRLHDLFGADWEDYDTSVYVEECPAETAGAHRYWRVAKALTPRASTGEAPT
jgi:hypothetical protein